mgnify:CR=1 FL=1
MLFQVQQPAGADLRIQKCGGHPNGGYAEPARAGGTLPQHRPEAVRVSEANGSVAGGAGRAGTQQAGGQQRGQHAADHQRWPEAGIRPAAHQPHAARRPGEQGG